mgnify:CR=1 FL=1
MKHVVLGGVPVPGVLGVPHHSEVGGRAAVSVLGIS